MERQVMNVGARRGLRRSPVAAVSSVRAFTLVELMVAVGMMAIFMSIAIPTLFQNMHRDSMRKAVSDVMEACSVARARAILDGAPMELRIHPVERTFSVGPAAQAPAGPPGSEFGPEGLPERIDYQWGARMEDHGGGAGSSGPSTFSVKLGQSIVIEGLGVNGEDWTEDPQASVRFYPNGTCDEMSVILLSDQGERRNIFLEVVTGFADLEVDPLKFRVR